MSPRLAVPCLAVVTLLALGAAPAVAADGAELYEINCARCHGADGRADTPVGKAMKVPALAGKTVTAEQLAAVVNENAKHKGLKDMFSEEDLQALAETIASFEP